MAQAFLSEFIAVPQVAQFQSAKWQIAAGKAAQQAWTFHVQQMKKAKRSWQSDVARLQREMTAKALAKMATSILLIVAILKAKSMMCFADGFMKRMERIFCARRILSQLDFAASTTLAIVNKARSLLE